MRSQKEHFSCLNLVHQPQAVISKQPNLRLTLGMLLLVAFVSSWLLLANISHAANAWQGKYYAHFSQGESLGDMLQDFSATLNVPVMVSTKLEESDREKMNGNLEGGAKSVLDKVSRMYNLQWYYDNHMIYVYKSSEAVSQLIRLNNTSPAAFKESLIQSDVYDSRFAWQPVRGVSSVLVSGPPRYVQLVSQIAKMMAGMKTKDVKNSHTVKVFPLRFASARDRVITTRGQSIRVPGVATSVQRILARENNPNFVAQPEAALAVDEMNRNGFTESSNGVTGVSLKGEGLAGNGEGSKISVANQPRVINSPRGGSSFVEPSPQQNAIIVYDLESRMPLYQSLIASLDVPSDQVEIEVSIIDVKTTRLKDLGINWQANGSDAQGGFGKPSDAFVATDGAQATFGDKVNLSTIMAGQVDYFMGRVRALARDGDSQILSQPTVLTLDNQEAFIDNSSTFFVRLQGYEEVDLVPITVGSVLRVTPRIMDKRARIALDIDISDGERNGQSVDDIPSISSSRINTQAMVGTSSSLLVGGYFYDQRAASENKIPILGDIPILKLLFSNSTKERVKVARLFLITPRVVTSDPKQLVNSRSKKVKLMVDREKGFHDTKYEKPTLSIFD